ncbi:MAG: GHKL domain-containing protein [Schwartzia sp.]|nr:GHKL domain-containing protein [Schwartzia sp. (in: firmicutes)]
MPTTSAEGHGIGMVSLAAFRKKYDADVVFEQEDGWVRLMIYWVTV